MSVFSALQEVKSADDACRFHKDDAIWISKQVWVGPAEAMVRAQVSLSKPVIVYHEVALKSYSAIVQFLFKHYVTDGNIARLHADVRSVWQGLMAAVEYGQEQWKIILNYRSVSVVNLLRACSWKDVPAQFAGLTDIGKLSTNTPL